MSKLTIGFVKRRHLQGFALRGSSEDVSHGDRLFHQAHTGKLCVINSLRKKEISELFEQCS